MSSLEANAAEVLRLQTRLRVLSEVTRAFAEETSDYARLLGSVARLLAEAIHDNCVVLLLSDDGQTLDPVAMHAIDPAALERVRARFAAHPIRVSEHSAAQETLRSGLPWLDRDPSRASLSEEHLAFGRSLGVHSRMMVALRLRGRSIGLLALARSRPDAPPFDAHDQELVQILADHAALAIENARAYAAEHAARIAREAAEQRYRALLEHANDAIALLDERGVVLEVNRAWERMTGVKRAQIEGRAWTEFRGIPADELDAHKADYERTFREGGGATAPLRFLRADGAESYAEASRAVFDVGGRTYVLSISRDVTERVRAEAALHRCEERFKNLSGAGILGIITADLDGAILDANDTFLSMVGYSREDLAAGRVRWDEMTPAEWRAVDDRSLEQLRTRGVASPWEKEFVRRDGTRVPVTGGGVMLEGSPGACVAFIVDMSDLKRAEAAVRVLREQRAADAKFRGLLEAAPDAMVIAEPDGRIILVNAQTERLFGYTRAELLNQSVERLLPERFRLRDLDGRDAGAELTGEGIELQGLRANGTEFPMEVRRSPLETEEGVLTSHSIRDISDRRAQRLLREHQERLRQMAFDATVAEERMRRRLAVVLHDGVGQSLALMQIKLAAARGALQGAPRAVLDEVVAMLEQTIAESRSLVFDLSPPILYDLGIGAALSWLVEKFETDHGLRVALADDVLDKPLDDATASIVFRTVRELLMNVVKHAGVREARVSLGRSGDDLEVCVEDAGVGFDSDAGALPPRAGGFGLLSVCEQIGCLGGVVSITSAPGRGTRTHVRVPLRRASLKHAYG